MKTYNFSAIVNFPDGISDDIELRKDRSEAELFDGISAIMGTCPDATSFVITIVVNSEKKE